MLEISLRVPKPKDFKPISITKNFDIEIGCGVGLHAIQYCKNNPDRTLFAIEKTEEKFGKFSRRISNHPDIKNLIAVRGDGMAWVVHGIPEKCVDQYFFLYPNPYPKNAQKNLRFHNMPTFAAVMDSLKIGGFIHLATNEVFYAEEAERVSKDQWGLKLIEKEKWNQKPRTHFEKKYLERGEDCWNLVWQKI
jgi:tRNA (guanine-N7-)-methyltransferase